MKKQLAEEASIHRLLFREPWIKQFISMNYKQRFIFVNRNSKYEISIKMYASCKFAFTAGSKYSECVNFS